jgi:hypothetical protein
MESLFAELATLLLVGLLWLDAAATYLPVKMSFLVDTPYLAITILHFKLYRVYWYYEFVR